MILSRVYWLALLCFFVGSSLCAEEYIPGRPVEASFKQFASGFLQRNCLDCHGETEPEAGLSLHDLGPVEVANSAIWKSVWAQVALREMPPKDHEQPTTVERLKFTDWIVGQLQVAMQDKGGFHAHQDPNKANFVDHTLLFGELPQGIKLLPASSPTRIWRVTREEHITRLNELINKVQSDLERMNSSD